MAQKTKKNKAEGIVDDSVHLEELLSARTEDEILRDKITLIARQQIKTSVEYKRQRMDEVQKSIDLYHGKTKKALKGRWNIPLPMMSGYVDTVLSKTDDAPHIKFGYQDLADKQRAAKVQAKWEQDSSSVEGRWKEKDRQEKKLAFFYGVGIKKYFAFNDTDGSYRSHLEIVDPLDFECEPLGGQNLADHKFMGQRNIFKTENQLKTLAIGDEPIYDKKQVLRLIAAYGSSENKDFEKLYQEKTERLRSLGFNPEQHSYVGMKIYNMTEWFMEYDGIWYYLLMEPHSGICVRFAKRSDIMDCIPFDAWHTHPDAFNFWSKAAADDMRPVAEGMNIIFNQALDNREKKNYGQRAYDPAVFPDPSQLEWRPDGLVETTAGISATQTIGGGVYSFQIPDMPESGTINLMEFMDNMAGLKTGITAAAQGASDEKRVGIYFGNLQQVSDRLGLYNKAYSESWGRLGWKYYLGLRRHIKSNRMMVRMVGIGGFNWVEMVKEDLDPTREFNIEVVGGQSQIQLDEINKKTRTESVLIAAKLGKINLEVATEEILRNGAWDDGQVRRLMDMQSMGTDDMMSYAEQAIQDLVYNNIQPKLYRKATHFFMQYILDKADEIYDHEDVTLEEYQALIKYAEAHGQIAIENMVRQTRLMDSAIMTAPQGGPGVKISGGGTPANPALPVGNEGQPLTPAATIAAGRANMGQPQ